MAGESHVKEEVHPRCPGAPRNMERGLMVFDFHCPTTVRNVQSQGTFGDITGVLMMEVEVSMGNSAK